MGQAGAPGCPLWTDVVAGLRCDRCWWWSLCIAVAPRHTPIVHSYSNFHTDLVAEKTWTYKSHVAILHCFALFSATFAATGHLQAQPPLCT